MQPRSGKILKLPCGENKNCRLLNCRLWYMLVASTWRFSTFAAILTYFQPPAKGYELLREAYVEAYPSSAYGHRVKGRVSASVHNKLKDWVRKAFDQQPKCRQNMSRMYSLVTKEATKVPKSFIVDRIKCLQKIMSEIIAKGGGRTKYWGWIPECLFDVFWNSRSFRK